uniref:Hsp90 chaperone protein kinase-targeting subunit n=1 Tax=Pinguiococcus pyrenoidosus TaxID=172671 RepID=A0A7R9YE37_9STRA
MQPLQAKRLFERLLVFAHLQSFLLSASPIVLIMAKPFDYSKWDNIELSDDESDLHPNIDKESWFRLKHRTRVEREEREEQEKKNLLEANRLADIRIAEIDANLKLVEDGRAEEVDEDPDAMQAEKQQLLELNKERSDRLEHMEKNRKWNWENMCHTVEETTTISASAEVGETGAGAPKRILKQARGTNQAPAASSASTATSTAGEASTKKAAAKPRGAPAASASDAATQRTPPAPTESSARAAAAAGPATEGEELEGYTSFVEAHESLLETFIDTESVEKTQQLLRDHPTILLKEHASSYLLLSCLEDEMNGNHSRMRLCARQSQILSNIAELAKSMNRHPRDILDAFFVKMREGQHFMEFMKQTQGFVERIQKRAVEKRKEMAAAGETEAVPLGELSREERLGPGGLDPVEVFDSLSPALQEAFESRDTEKLKAALEAMPMEEAQSTLQRCIDSGLWVA